MDWRKSWAVVAAGLLSSAYGAIELVHNGSFEDMEGDQTINWSVGRHFRFEGNCGMNGTRGLAFENLDEKDFYEFPSQCVVFERGRRYQYSVMVRTENLQGSVGLCVEWFDKKGEWLSGSYQSGLRGTHDWSKMEGATPPIPSDAAKVRLAFFVSKGGLGKVWFDDVSMRLLSRPVFGGLYSSAYRNIQASGKVRFVAAINRAEHPQSRAFFTYVDAACVTQRVPPTKMTESAAVLEIEAAHLARGSHPVSCELVSTTGQVLGSGTLDFERPHKLPARKTYIDGRGHAIVDGKPFFPLGIYLGGVRDEGLDENLLSGPFNCFMPYRCSRAGLDRCQEKGFKVIYPLNSEWAWHKLRTKSVQTDADADAVVERTVNAVKDHPAVLAWYTNDEIPIEKFPQLLSRQKLLERIDPEHPTWTVLYQFGEVRSYYPTFDVIGTDPYPVPQAPIGNAALWTRTTQEEAMGLKPMWQVPQAFGWGDFDPKKAETGRFPTRAEMENMTWQCVANGANGIVYWCYRLLYQKGKFRVDRWADICAAAASIKAYFPIFLANEDEPIVKGATENLSVRAWRYQGSVYVALVNNTREPTQSEITVDAEWNRPTVLQGAAKSLSCAEKQSLRVTLDGLAHAFLRLDAAR